MNREMQDRIWSFLPKEAREEIKSIYSAHTKRQIITAQDTLLDDLFGRENLESDTEPEEILHINRKTVIDKYAEIFWNKAPYLNDSTEALSCQACLNVLKSLFGSKCMPDATVAFSATVGKEEPKPKFKVGDKVVSKVDNNIVCTVEYQSPVTRQYRLYTGDNCVIHRLEKYLEPYIE